MSAKKFIIPAIGVAALAGGGAAAYLTFFKPASLDAFNPQAIAKMVPDEAYMVAYVSTDEKAWAKLDQFGTPEAQKLVRKGMEDFQKSLTSETQFSFEQDIKPWAGNVMVALMPSDSGKPASEPNVLMVIGIKDKPAALSFANKVKASEKGEIKETDYKGVKVAAFPGQKVTTYTANVNDYLLVSPDRKAMEAAIDTAKGEPSLASQAGDSLNQNLELQNTLARVYVPDYGKAVQYLTASSTPPLPSSTLEQLKQLKSLSAAIGVDEHGVRLKAVTKLGDQLANMEFKPAPGSVVAQFPSETFALMSSVNMSGYWKQASDSFQSDPQMKGALDEMRQQMKQVNLDLDKEIFGWMDGEFAIGMIPSNQGLLASVGFGGAIVIDTSDRKTAENTLTKLDTLAKTAGYVTINQRNIDGKTLTEWQTPMGALVGHTWLDQDTLLIALGDSTITQQPGKQNQALNNSDTFKAVTASLPKQNGGYFYLDMDKTVSLMNTMMVSTQSQPMQPEAMAVMNSIRGVGMTSNRPDKTTTQFEVLLSLKPASQAAK